MCYFPCHKVFSSSYPVLLQKSTCDLSSDNFVGETHQRAPTEGDGCNNIYAIIMIIVMSMLMIIVMLMLVLKMQSYRQSMWSAEIGGTGLEECRHGSLRLMVMRMHLVGINNGDNMEGDLKW